MIPLTKATRMGGSAAIGLIAVTLLVVGCGAPEGTGTVHMSAIKEVAASRGLADAKRAPISVDAGKVGRGKASAAPVKPQRGGHR